MEHNQLIYHGSRNTSSTQVDVGRNAGGTHAGRTLGIYTHGTLAVLAVSDTNSQASRPVSNIISPDRSGLGLLR
jgi:hypothetical protein